MWDFRFFVAIVWVMNFCVFWKVDIAFNSLTLLVWWQEGHPACKNWVVRYLRGYLCGVRCKWFAAYGPADATVTPSSLAPVKSRMVYFSSAGLPRLSWKKDRETNVVVVVENRVRPLYTSDIKNRQHRSLLEHWRIGVGRPPMSMLSKIVVLLRPPNFNRHRSGQLPLNLTMFSAVFLGAVSWKLSLTILRTCDSHLNITSFDPAWIHFDSALLPPRIPSPLARFGQHDCPAMRRGLRSLHLLAGLGDLNQPVLRRLYHLSETHADAMSDVTLVVLLSVHWELRSEYAELSFDTFCVLPHSVPVKVARRSTPGVETAGQLYSKRLSISYHPTPGKRQAATNTTPLFRGMQAAAFTCADLTRRSGVKCEWYLQAAVQIALISFRAWSQPPTRLSSTELTHLELNSVG